MHAAPFICAGVKVQPGWGDVNNHMNLAYYLVMFDTVTDTVFEALGIGEDYRRDARQNAFAAETHVVYEHEMLIGETADIHTTIIAADGKRLHLAHEMFRSGNAARACMQELMLISVDLESRRAAPWTPAAMANIQAALALHGKLPRPAKLGRQIGFKRI